MPQKRLDTTFLGVYTKTVLSFYFVKFNLYLNENAPTYAAVFDVSPNVRGRFIKHILKRPMYGKINLSIVVLTKEKIERKDCPSYMRS